MTHLAQLEKELIDLRLQLKDHSLYQHLNDLQDVQTFMEQHVFAVWDFMSLLKALQQKLTCTTLPWVPAENATIARFINEIVWGEESDLNHLNQPQSHYEMYLNAMEEIGANTQAIRSFVASVAQGEAVESALSSHSIDPTVADFVRFTFKVIASGKTHCIASAFTFGREDVIPDMFIEIVEQSQKENHNAAYPQLLYYLERHIEVDGDEHGPLSRQLMEELCQTDPTRWQEATEIAIKALQLRIQLWDRIAERILEQQPLALNEH